MIRVGARVRLLRLSDDPDWIEAETGYADVRRGLLGTVVADEGLECWEVELDRNGERLSFGSEELEVIE